MSSMFDELRNFWLRVEVVFAACTFDAPEMRTPVHCHGTTSLAYCARWWGAGWACTNQTSAESPGLLGCWVGREVRVGLSTCSHALSVLIPPQTPRSSQQPQVFFLSLSLSLLCWGRNPGPHTNWASVLPLSYTPDLPVSVCIPLKHLRAWLYSRNTILD